MKGEKRQRLIAALDAAAADNGFELVDVELASAGSSRIVRVLLDREGGCGIDELAGANPWVDAAVEANEPYFGAYTLEVSSPGIDRPLRTPAHFARFVGEEARLATGPLEGRRSWTGTLVGVTEAAVLLLVDGEERAIPYESIRKAHLLGRVGPDNRKSRSQEGTDDVV
ncbi:MAG: ribosome maturation factor RimP [Coriobacteriales bacterium]|nr:ribosome maturation factor RimP [Coriobacteriales bacterium]